MKKKTVATLVGGIAAGAALGVLLAPKSGKETRDDLKKAFDCLNQREKQVIQERYYQGYSQCEIADELFVSQAQISRIEKKALEKLHKRLV